MNAGKIIEIARQYIGVKEIGNNEGFSDPALEQGLREVGWRPLLPWCGFFCKHVYVTAYKDTEWESLFRKILSGSVMATWNMVKTSSVLRKTTEISEGGIFMYSTGNGKGHMGLIEKKLEEHRGWTVEGNTSLSRTDRDGDGVGAHRRNFAKTIGKQSKWIYLGCLIPPPYDTEKPSHESPV